MSGETKTPIVESNVCNAALAGNSIVPSPHLLAVLPNEEPFINPKVAERGSLCQAEGQPHDIRVREGTILEVWHETPDSGQGGHYRVCAHLELYNLQTNPSRTLLRGWSDSPNPSPPPT